MKDTDIAAVATSPEQKAMLLDHYQGIVSRLAGNSSSLKGWAVSVVMALIGFAVKDGPSALGLLAIVPLAVFWMLDSCYLAAERIYRGRYNDAVRSTAPVATIGSAGLGTRDIARALASPVNLGVYLSLAILAVAVGLYHFTRAAHAVSSDA